LARLLNDPVKYAELNLLMLNNQDVAVAQTSSYDKNGELFPITEWILHNVFLYPTFGHESFVNNLETYEACVGTEKIKIPANSLLLIDYVGCNRSIDIKSQAEFSDMLLADSFTIGKFILDKRVASFGGSVVNKNNRQTRVCPGAKTSLLEQSMMLAMILRKFSLKGSEISCDIDIEQHPVISRVNQGFVQINKSTP
jgi:hypothetical protein